MDAPLKFGNWNSDLNNSHLFIKDNMILNHLCMFFKIEIKSLNKLNCLLRSNDIIVCSTQNLKIVDEAKREFIKWNSNKFSNES